MTNTLTQKVAASLSEQMATNHGLPLSDTAAHNLAATALLALGEPTDAMLEAGRIAVGGNTALAADVWYAMAAARSAP